MRRSVWRSPASLGLLAGVLAIVIAHACELDGAASAARGDAAKGERLFATLPCVSCHNLGNIATEAARIIRLGEYRGKARTAADYIRESILDPNAYIVPGASYRTPDGKSVMPKDFGATLTGAQIDDLVAYLLTRR